MEWAGIRLQKCLRNEKYLLRLVWAKKALTITVVNLLVGTKNVQDYSPVYLLVLLAAFVYFPEIQLSRSNIAAPPPSPNSHPRIEPDCYGFSIPP